MQRYPGGLTDGQDQSAQKNGDAQKRRRQKNEIQVDRKGQESEMKIDLSDYSNEEIARVFTQYCHNCEHLPILIDRHTKRLTVAQLAEKYNRSENGIKYILSKNEHLLLKLFK